MIAEIWPELLIGGITLIGSVGIAYGMLKGKQDIFITHPDHRQICDEKQMDNKNSRKEIYNLIEAKFDKADQKRDRIIETLGNIEGQLLRMNGGSKK